MIGLRSHSPHGFDSDFNSCPWFQVDLIATSIGDSVFNAEILISLVGSVDGNLRFFRVTRNNGFNDFFQQSELKSCSDFRSLLALCSLKLKRHLLLRSWRCSGLFIADRIVLMAAPVIAVRPRVQLL